MDSESRELILRQLRAIADQATETARVARETRETCLGLERRLGAVEGHVMTLAGRDCEQTSQVAGVRVELAQLAARSSTAADRAETAAARTERGRGLRAALQAAGVVAGVAIASAAQQCTTHQASTTVPPGQTTGAK